MRPTRLRPRKPGFLVRFPKELFDVLTRPRARLYALLVTPCLESGAVG